MYCKGTVFKVRKLYRQDVGRVIYSCGCKNKNDFFVVSVHVIMYNDLIHHNIQGVIINFFKYIKRYRNPTQY